MKLAILSHDSRLHSTQRLVRSARARGYNVRVLNPFQCCLCVADNTLGISYKGRPIVGYQAVIPRIGSSMIDCGLAVLRQFEFLGSVTPNNAAAIACAHDKLHCHQLLAANGIAQPNTLFSGSSMDMNNVFLSNHAAHIIKLNRGAQGAGVFLAKSSAESRSMCDVLHDLHVDFLMQEFISEANGADIRCFVVGYKVVAAICRQAPHGEFRSNLHRGGGAREIVLSETENVLAVRAATTLGLGIAGVDLIQSKRGFLVLEVNSSPGLEGIENATGCDIAGCIVDYVASRVQNIV